MTAKDSIKHAMQVVPGWVAPVMRTAIFVAAILTLAVAEFDEQSRTTLLTILGIYVGVDGTVSLAAVSAKK